ncbi:MAG: DNA mismatch repair protein MutS, partial [Firmicutes bacterium]|nr:DNA mismatch repair protein MutS [Bacillota bacterium]
SVSEKSGDVVFLHKIMEGSASKSYGIHVAKIAGVPQTLLDTAQDKLSQLEKGSSGTGELLVSENASAAAVQDEPQLSFITFANHPAVEMIRSIDIMSITPSGAIAVIEQLKKAVEE